MPDKIWNGRTIEQLKAQLVAVEHDNVEFTGGEDA